MQYKIAYGVNQSHTKKRELLDAFIVASMNNDEQKMQEILSSFLQKQATKQATISKEPFAHLKKGAI